MFILYFSDQTGFTGQVCFNTASRSDVKGRKVWWDEYENCKKGLIWYSGGGRIMKQLYREIKINKPGLRFLPKLSLSGLAEVVYFYLLI